jgi:hypothetical protein
MSSINLRRIPMAVTAKYTAPLQVVETRETRNRIIEVAEAEGISQAEVIRDIIAHGIEWREQLSKQRQQV